MLEFVYKDTGTLPPPLASKPALRRDCFRYYEAFTSLGASRIWSQVGPQPLQTTEILAYVRALGIESSATTMKYLRLIRRLDRVELAFHAKQQAKRKT